MAEPGSLLVRSRVHRALSRPNLLMGADRELVLVIGLAAAILIFVVLTWYAAIFGIAIWLAAVAALRMMAKSDPLMRKVYDLRPIVRAAMSWRRSAPASRRVLPVRSERAGALPISRPVLAGRAAQCDRHRMAETRSSGFGGAAAGRSKAATRCGGIEHVPVGMRSNLEFYGKFWGQQLPKHQISRNWVMVGCLHVQLGRDQIGKPKTGSHGADSPSETRPVESQTSSRLSQTPVTKPIDTREHRAG